MGAAASRPRVSQVAAAPAPNQGRTSAAPIANASTPAKIRQIDNKGTGNNFGPGALQQFDGRFRRATGGQKIIHQQNPLPPLDRINVDLYFVGAIFEFVFLGECFPGKLALLANGHKSGPDLLGDRRTEDKSSGLHSGDVFDARLGETGGQHIYRRGKCLGISQ